MTFENEVIIFTKYPEDCTSSILFPGSQAQQHGPHLPLVLLRITGLVHGQGPALGPQCFLMIRLNKISKSY